MSNPWQELGVSCAMMVALCAAPAWADGVLDTAVAEFQLVPMAGATPPPFSLDTLEGKTLSPGDLKGRAVLLYFWATW